MKVFYGGLLIGHFAGVSGLPPVRGYIFRVPLRPTLSASYFPFSGRLVDIGLDTVNCLLLGLQDRSGFIQEWACELLADPWLAPRLPGWRPEEAGIAG